MNIGYVFLVNENWLPLAEVLIQMLCIFSKYKIELFTVNCDCPFKYDNLITHKIITDVKHPDLIHRIMCYTKFQAVHNSSFDFGMFIDADMIPNKNIDELLEENYRLYKDTEYPVCAHHPHNPWQNPTYAKTVKFLQKRFNFKVVMPYKYAQYCFSKNCKRFFETAIKMGKIFTNNRYEFFGNDELIINILINKFKAYNQLDFNYFPNYWLYKDVLNGTFDINEEYIDDYKNHNCIVKPYLFHGCKDIDKVKQMSMNILKKYIVK